MIDKLASLLIRLWRQDRYRYERVCNLVYERLDKHTLWAAWDECKRRGWDE